MNKTVLVVIRALFRLASLIAPKATGRAAFRLFCTTFKIRNNSTQYQQRLQTAQALFDHAAQHTVEYEGGTIAAYEFKPNGAVSNNQTVWLVHGWQSHALLMSHFVEPLLEKGFSVIGIDLPGHGKSSGRTFHLPLATQALNAVRATVRAPDMILSHSMGGAVAATALAGTLPGFPAIPVEKLVLISSPDSMTKLFNDFASMINLRERSREQLDIRVMELSGKTTDDFQTGKQLKDLNNDLLLIHAPDDKETPYSESESIAQHNPRAILKPATGLGHRRIIASDEIVQTAVDFLSKDLRI